MNSLPTLVCLTLSLFQLAPLFADETESTRYYSLDSINIETERTIESKHSNLATQNLSNISEMATYHQREFNSLTESPFASGSAEENLIYGADPTGSTHAPEPLHSLGISSNCPRLNATDYRTWARDGVFQDLHREARNSVGDSDDMNFREVDVDYLQFLVAYGLIEEARSILKAVEDPSPRLKFIFAITDVLMVNSSAANWPYFGCSPEVAFWGYFTGATLPNEGIDSRTLIRLVAQLPEGMTRRLISNVKLNNTENLPPELLNFFAQIDDTPLQRLSVDAGNDFSGEQNFDRPSSYQFSKLQNILAGEATEVPLRIAALIQELHSSTAVVSDTTLGFVSSYYNQYRGSQWSQTLGESLVLATLRSEGPFNALRLVEEISTEASISDAVSAEVFDYVTRETTDSEFLSFVVTAPEDWYYAALDGNRDSILERWRTIGFLVSDLPPHLNRRINPSESEPSSRKNETRMDSDDFLGSQRYSLNQLALPGFFGYQDYSSISLLDYQSEPSDINFGESRHQELILRLTADHNAAGQEEMDRMGLFRSTADTSSSLADAIEDYMSD